MSQVSEALEILNRNTVFYGGEDGEAYRNYLQLRKECERELLSIILEALPEKEEPLYGDGWDKWDDGHINGHNTALDEVKEALNVVFGVEG